jgi:hypothetical protein
MRPKYESFHPRQGNLDESIDPCQSKCFFDRFFEISIRARGDQELYSGTPALLKVPMESKVTETKSKEGAGFLLIGSSAEILIRSVPNPTASRLAVNAMDSH